MENKLLNIVVSKLSDEVDELKQQLSRVLIEIAELKKNGLQNLSSKLVAEEDELLNTKEVLAKLDICYNTLSKLIKQGLIKPIRISLRRIRFSKASIIRYIGASNT